MEVSEGDSRAVKGTKFALDRISRARANLAVLKDSVTLSEKDYDAVWEAYYCLEEAILVARIAFSGFDSPGHMRKLPELPRKITEEIFRAILQATNNGMDAAENEFHRHRGPRAVDDLRRARDQLKGLLLTRG